MTDPAIIEAAARALQDSLGNTLLPILNRHVASIVLTAVTPLIEDAALERAATVCEEWTGQILSPTIGDHYALLIRALKEQP